MVQARVEATLAAAGHRVRSLDALPPDGTLPSGLDAVLLDLNTPGWEPMAAAARRAAIPALAFGQHVDEARLRQARAAGCRPVVARSRFFAEMPDLVAGLAASPAS